MVIVVDEDIPRSFVQCFREHGFTALDIRDQDLQGTTDDKIMQFFLQKKALFLTGDIDFATRIMRKKRSKGILLNRLPDTISLGLRLKLLRLLLKTLEPRSLLGYITILEAGKIRRRRL